MAQHYLSIPLAVAALVLGSASSCNAQFRVDKQLSQDGRIAYAELYFAKRFEPTTLGIAAIPSRLRWAFCILRNEARADASFKSLLRDASAAGKLYALCGLYYTDRAYFDSVIEHYRTSDESVEAQNGCVIWRATVAEFVDADVYADAVRSRGGTVPAGGVTDILHGGYPTALGCEEFKAALPGHAPN
jgi:hypothetical protein